MSRVATVVFVTGLVWQAAAADVELDRRALEEALAIGQSRIEGVRTRFHEPYRVTVGAPPVDYLDVVTPFRAVVLAAQARARAGDRQFGLRQARETYAQTSDETVVYIELTFHPQNTFIGIPDYGITLEGGSATFEPVSIGRIPRFGPRVGGYPFQSTSLDGAVVLPGGSQPLTGGTLVYRLPVARMDPQGRYDLVVLDRARQLARVSLDLGRLR
jgi:hypothetical protein